MPKPGDIAYCGLNKLGLITSEQPTQVNYGDGQKGFAWTGVHLTSGEKHCIGGPWSSREPKVVAHIDLAMELLHKALHDFARDSALTGTG